MKIKIQAALKRIVAMQNHMWRGISRLYSKPIASKNHSNNGSPYYILPSASRSTLCKALKLNALWNWPHLAQYHVRMCEAAADIEQMEAALIQIEAMTMGAEKHIAEQALRFLPQEKL